MDCLEQAKIIYPKCVEFAKASNTLTYRDSLDSMGYGANKVTGNAIRYGLTLTWLACTDAQLPKLTAIIVEKYTGEPSDGFPMDSWKADTQLVFGHQELPDADDLD